MQLLSKRETQREMPELIFAQDLSMNKWIENEKIHRRQALVRLWQEEVSSFPYLLQAEELL